MLEKTRGAVGCGHCQRLGATEICPLCGRPVCERCLTPDACPSPGPRVIKLGVGRRLRAVDHSGRLGLVTSWWGRAQVLDLYTGSTRITRLPGRVGRPVPCLVAPDLMIKIPSPVSNLTPGLLSFIRLGLRRRKGHPAARELQTGVGQIVEMGLSGDGHYILLKGDTETLALVDPREQRVQAVLEMPRQVVYSGAANLEMDLAALGTYGRVGLFRISDRQPLGQVRLEQGGVVWVGLAGGRLVTITETCQLVVLEADPGREPSRWERSLETRLDPDAVRHESMAEVFGGMVPMRVWASLSGDGQLLVIRWRQGRELATFRLPRGLIQVFAGHSDTVNLVRFVGQGRMLVTGGADARVVFWPRVGHKMVPRPGPAGPAER
jgi:hypothetical protein